MAQENTPKKYLRSDIIDTAVCPHPGDGDSKRASLLNDGNIFCVFCGVVPGTDETRKRAADIMAERAANPPAESAARTCDDRHCGCRRD